MEKAKVYFSDLRTSPTSNLLDKMERLLKRAGIGQLPLKDSFTAIKIHFGEPGNLAYIRPNYAARMANLLRSFGAKPFLTNRLYQMCGMRTMRSSVPARRRRSERLGYVRTAELQDCRIFRCRAERQAALPYQFHYERIAGVRLLEP